MLRKAERLSTFPHYRTSRHAPMINTNFRSARTPAVAPAMQASVVRSVKARSRTWPTAGALALADVDPSLAAHAPSHWVLPRCWAHGGPACRLRMRCSVAATAGACPLRWPPGMEVEALDTTCAALASGVGMHPA